MVRAARRWSAPRAKRGRAAGPRLLLLVAACALLLPAVAGCGGCGSSKKQVKKKEEPEEVAKPNYEQSRLTSEPATGERIESIVKPGHWTAGSIDVIANNFNFNGRLVTQPFVIPGTVYRMGTVRPALLPKAQKKTLALTYFVPALDTGHIPTSIADEQKNIGVWLENRTASNIARARYPNTLLYPHQYTLVALCRDPERYTHLQRRDCMRSQLPFDAQSDGTDLVRSAWYRVQVPLLDKRIPLAENPLTCTSIAYLIWDDVEPDRLSAAQQQALVDWLNWGGQLLISGPISLDLLKGSFLEPLLPAAADGAIELSADDFAGVAKVFAEDGEPPALPKPVAGQVLRLVDGARVVAGSEERPLVVDRSVGRGRVLVSAFRLSEIDLWKWPAFDGFFNAAVLRRPPRRFSAGPEAMAIDVTLATEESVRHDRSRPAANSAILNQFGNQFASVSSPIVFPDPRPVTKVRYFSRDADDRVAPRTPNAEDEFLFESAYRHRTSPAA